MSDPLIALVTGASRGAGRGIAVALGAVGATVYVTSRPKPTLTPAEESVPCAEESVELLETAVEVTRAGGRGVAVACDHSDDRSVAALFDRIGREQEQLDLLVNNAIALPDGLSAVMPFWEKPLDQQAMFDVGLRSSYITSWYAAPLLIRNGGLVVNTSSFGGGCYMHGPAYGAVKAGVDKLAHDMAVDFAPFDVAVVSIWMGILRTERTMAGLSRDPGKYGDLLEQMESPEFTGRVIAALYKKADRQRWSGRTVVGAELAQELGVTDLDGRQPGSHRAMLGGPIEFNSAQVH